ncbi:MAG: hypothetical protein WKF97_26600 [Chitinophagaceae bacterium]
MQNLLKGSLVLTTFALAVILFQISCKKDTTAQTTTTPVLTKEQILVQKEWKVDRLHHVLGGAYSSYSDGGTNTTRIPYEKLRFTFNSNGTGIYIDQFGSSYPTNWKFTTADKRALTLTVNAAAPFTNYWEMVEIADNYLHASVNLTISGNSNNIETFRLIQMP